jgi:hypothetical protein
LIIRHDPAPNITHTNHFSVVMHKIMSSAEIREND